MESGIIDFAHSFSKKINKPVSKIVENYFSELKKHDDPDLPKNLEELYGIFEGIKTPDKKGLRKLFHEKHSD